MIANIDSVMTSDKLEITRSTADSLRKLYKKSTEFMSQLETAIDEIEEIEFVRKKEKSRNPTAIFRSMKSYDRVLLVVFNWAPLHPEKLKNEYLKSHNRYNQIRGGWFKGESKLLKIYTREGELLSLSKKGIDHLVALELVNKKIGTIGPSETETPVRKYELTETGKHCLQRCFEEGIS